MISQYDENLFCESYQSCEFTKYYILSFEFLPKIESNSINLNAFCFYP